MWKYISKKVLWTIICILAIIIIVFAIFQISENKDPATITAAKPIIYLYPESETDVEVRLDLNGQLGVTYPAYDDRWRVNAFPDGKLINRVDGGEYSYLFWEGDVNINCDMSSGFVVAGSDTVEFLREKLSLMGLIPKEYNDFIVYWAPKMQSNAYNLISFQGNTYTDVARLEISPAPDSELRVFMAFKSIDRPIAIPEQKLEAFERIGFTVIEWGGAELK